MKQKTKSIVTLTLLALGIIAGLEQFGIINIAITLILILLVSGSSSYCIHYPDLKLKNPFCTYPNFPTVRSIIKYYGVHRLNEKFGTNYTKSQMLGFNLKTFLDKDRSTTYTYIYNSLIVFLVRYNPHQDDPYDLNSYNLDVPDSIRKLDRYMKNTVFYRIQESKIRESKANTPAKRDKIGHKLDIKRRAFMKELGIKDN